MISESTPTVTPRWPLLRLTPGHETEVTLLSVGWLQLGTHFHNHTFMCAGGHSCPACDHLTKRNVWYLPILARDKPHLLELSAFAAADLEQHSRMYWGRFAAGQVLIAVRHSNRQPIKFSPVRIRELKANVDLRVWVSAVMAIYGFPPMEKDEPIDRYRIRLAPLAEARAKAVAAKISQGM